MKHICKCALRSYMTRCLTDARKQSHLTQARFSEKLMMDTRSYANLKHGKSLCCTLTFIIYLVFFCKEVDALIQEKKSMLSFKTCAKSLSLPTRMTAPLLEYSRSPHPPVLRGDFFLLPLDF